MNSLQKGPLQTRLRLTVLGSFLIILNTPFNAIAQGEAALPFLLISPDPSANAWGGVSTTVVSDNAIAIATNPGQLGAFSLENYFSASGYLNKTAWLPAFQQSDLTYNAWAIAAGYNLSDLLPLPFPISFGLGYSRIDLNLGTFIRTGPGSPDPIGTFHAYEQSKSTTIGLGIDYFLKVGLGWNFKDVHSVLAPLSSSTESSEASVSMTDFGLIVQAPIVEIAESIYMDSVRIFNSVKPLFALTFGYAQSNRGDDLVRYIDAALADPLPKNAITGLSVELGITKKLHAHEWRILAFTLAREAEDLLVIRSSDGLSFEYQSGWGDISFFKNVIAGEINGAVNLHKGWQLNVCDLLYLRGGSYAEAKEYGDRSYSTSGYAVRMSGLFRLLEQLAPDTVGDQVLSFISDHIDVVYDHAEYSDHPILGGTSFDALNFIMR